MFFCILHSGGWVILQVPPEPSLVSDTLKVMCRARGTPPLHEVILYKDAVEVMRQNGLNPYFYLTNLTHEEQGVYSCRASWDIDRRTHSVISADASVQILGEFIHWVTYAEFGCGCKCLNYCSTFLKMPLLVVKRSYNGEQTLLQLFFQPI